MNLYNSFFIGILGTCWYLSNSMVSCKQHSVQLEDSYQLCTPGISTNTNTVTCIVDKSALSTVLQIIKLGGVADTLDGCAAT